MKIHTSRIDRVDIVDPAVFYKGATLFGQTMALDQARCSTEIKFVLDLQVLQLH